MIGTGHSNAYYASRNAEYLGFTDCWWLYRWIAFLWQYALANMVTAKHITFTEVKCLRG